jgi:hypothetical protein
MFDIGAGIGVPYGVIGFKGTIGISPVQIPCGLNLGCSAGWLPFANDFFFNPTAELMILDRFKPVRPKISVSYSKGTAVIMIMSTNLDMLYYKPYPGIGAYAGIDWRPAKTLPISFDINIGWLFHSASKKEVIADYQRALDSLLVTGGHLMGLIREKR